MTSAAAILGALGALGVLLGRGRPLVAGGLVALAAAQLLLAGELLPESVGTVSTASVAGFAVGLVLLAGLAAVFVRYPAGVIPAVVAAAPFRSPFELDAGNRFFVGLGEAGALGRLVPLYAVVAAAGLALLWRLARGARAAGLPLVLALPAGLLSALTILSYLWAHDPAAAEDRLTFFVLPFVAVLALVARSPLRPWLPRVLAIEAIALASLFAVVGLAQSWTRTLFFYDPKIAVANEYTSYFRVTSLFSDPSIYARHVAVALAVCVVCVWLGRLAVLYGAAIAALLFAGLYVSYSQSSMVALAAALCLVALILPGRRARRLVAATGVALVVAGALALAGLLAAGFDHERVTSGRTTLVADTWRVVRTHPVEGVGVASQPAASRDLTDEDARSARRFVSHTAPLTVAAELGLVGLGIYLAFLAGALRLFLLVRRRDDALGVSLLAAATVLFVHSLSYGVFFDDPLVWALLGVAAAAAGRSEAALRLPEVVRTRRKAPAPAAP